MCKNFFSIILPAFNSERTIYKSIKSVLNQGFKDFELLIINDGSQDKTLKICKKFKKNKKVKIINNYKNIGVSRSRNEAIKLAKGKYIIFLDSDDFFFNNFLLNLYKTIKKKNYEVIIANNETIKKNILNNRLYWDLFRKNKLSSFCWNYIIQKDFIIKNKIFFDNLKVFEDQLFVLRLLTTVKKYKFFRKKFIKRNETFGSLGRLTNYQSALCTLKNLFAIYKLRKKIKNKIVYDFLSLKLNETNNYLNLYILTLNHKEKKTFSKNCEKMFNFNRNNNFFLDRLNSHQTKNYSSLINCVKEFKQKNKSSIYLYSASLYTRILIKLCENKFKKIIEQNSQFIGKSLFGIEIIDNKKIIKDKKKVLLVPKYIKIDKKIFSKIGFHKSDIRTYSFKLKKKLFGF